MVDLPLLPEPLFVLLVGDNLAPFERIGARLTERGYRTSRADTIPAVWRNVIKEQPYAVVMDATEPRAAWRPWTLCRELAESRAFLLVLLTLENCPRDRARALRCGADHCLPMVEHSGEALAAYLDAPKFRRGDRETTVQAPRWIGTATQIDWDNREICRNGETTGLSLKEFELLKLLVQHSGKTVLMDEIFQCLWRKRSRISCRANLKQVVRRLRGKLEIDPEHPQHLVSMRGVGYRLMLTPVSE